MQHKVPFSGQLKFTCAAYVQYVHSVENYIISIFELLLPRDIETQFAATSWESNSVACYLGVHVNVSMQAE